MFISLTNRFHTRDGQWHAAYRFMRLQHMAETIAVQNAVAGRADRFEYFMRKAQIFSDCCRRASRELRFPEGHS